MRETILKKATEMFLTLGFKSVTMDDIAAELGISKKTIYQHFTNKTELVEATTMGLFHTISGGIDNICHQGMNAIEEIFAIRSFMMNNLNNETASPFYQLQKFFPKIFAGLRTRQFEKVHGCMTENLNRGIAEGLYRKDVPVNFVSRIYFTGLTGIKDTDIFPPGEFGVIEATNYFLEYHMRAIVTPVGLEHLTEILNSEKKITQNSLRV